jgi:hypothetical protein
VDTVKKSESQNGADEQNRCASAPFWLLKNSMSVPVGPDSFYAVRLFSFPGGSFSAEPSLFSLFSCLDRCSIFEQWTETVSHSVLIADQRAVEFGTDDLQILFKTV